MELCVIGAWTSTLTLAVAVTLVVKCWRPLIVVTDDVGAKLPLLLPVLLVLQSLAELCWIRLKIKITIRTRFEDKNESLISYLI